MSDYYSKSQMDAIATEIGNRIDSNSGLNAADVDLAIAAYLLANPQAPKPDKVRYSNRIYFYTDRRWISLGDGNFGFQDVNSSESGGTGATPLVEWENLGIPFEAGDKLTSLQIRMRCNNLEVDDVEFYVAFVYPNLATRWNTGFDNDTEMTADVIFNDAFRLLAANPLTANINDRARQVIDLDYTCPDAGEVRVFARSTGTPTATRYGYCQTIFEYEAA